MIFTDSANNLIQQGSSASAGSSSSSSSSPIGQAFYGFGTGTYTWRAPPGVTSVCVVAIGGGCGSTTPTYTTPMGGGGLGWKNNISVTPGSDYTVVVGRAGDYLQAESPTSGVGGTSYFISTGVVAGYGGGQPTGGSYVGDGGGNGGTGAGNSGGGAGGYTGSGGNGNQSGSGGGSGGGGTYSSTHGYASGGGTGPFGQGPSGAYAPHCGGQGGSGGESGSGGENPWLSLGGSNMHGGNYGGGSGQGGNSSVSGGNRLYRGGRGCVRIIWGAGRSFPTTGTGDM